jgi:hypothetical protein
MERGKVATTAAELTALVQRLSVQDELLVGQEVGKLCHFVHALGPTRPTGYHHMLASSEITFRSGT